MSVKPSPRDPRGREYTGLVGRALSRDAVFYAMGMTAALPFGLALVAITTRYLSPADFGRSAGLLVLASLLAFFYGMGVIQGGIRWIYGQAAAGEDGDDLAVDDDDEQARAALGAAERHRALGSVFLAVAGVAAVGTVIVLLCAPAIRSLLGGARASHHAVVMASVSGAMGALYRQIHQPLRMERQMGLWLSVSLLRPAVALVLTWVLLEQGAGYEGPVYAMGLASLIATAYAFLLILVQRSVRFAPRRQDFVEIFRYGKPFFLILAGMWFVGQAGFFIVAHFGSSTTIGLYRLASRIADLPSYLTSAYLMSWASLQGSSLFRSARQEYRRWDFTSVVFTYWCVGCLLLLLLITVAADGLVLIAPPAYAGAAKYVPWLTAGVIAHGALYAIHRVARFPDRMRWYGVSLLLAAGLLVAFGFLLVPSLDVYGVAVAMVASQLLGACVMVWRNHLSVDQAVPFQWRRIALATVLACAAYATTLPWPLQGAARVPVDALAVLGFCGAVVGFGVIPRSTLPALWGVARAATGLRRAGRRLLRGVGQLPTPEQALLRLYVRERAGDDTVSRAVGVAPAVARARLTRALRILAGGGRAGAHDHELASFLVADLPYFERQRAADRLIAHGVDPLDLHALEETWRCLRHAPRRAWPRAGAV